jgi:calcium-translocating P-type ATPase
MVNNNFWQKEEHNISVSNEGLTEKEVRQSREKYGENCLKKKKQKSFLRSFLESFGDPMIKILLIALAINIIFLFRQANWFESIGIVVAILLATLVSTISEYGSESAFEKLQEEASRINCRVKRREGLKEIPVAQVVVGDIVLLQPGDRVPADGVLISGGLDIDQSSLNGESKEAVKYPQRQLPGPEKARQDFLNPSLLFSGTVVCSGEGYMRVTHVGEETIYGNIGAEIQEETRESPLKLRLGKLAAGVGRFSYIAAIFIALIYFFNVIVLDNKFNTAMILNTLKTPDVLLGHIMKAATLAVTVIVMAVPEGLPMMITVVLSANMKRMLKDNVLVRKLTGIETAGSLNILFTDKTGTLTRGKPQITHFISGSGRILTKKEAGSIPVKLQGVLHDSVYYNCAASMNDGAAIGGNATDRAALEFVSRLGNREQNIKKTNVIPFSSNTKFMATTVSGGWNATFIKGAPEKILPFCTGYYDEAGAVSGDFKKSRMDNIVKQLAEQAIRIIAVAISDSTAPENGNFKNLKLVGLLGIRDEIRRETIEGLRLVHKAGIQTVMITGDSKLTALAIARETGLVKKDGDIVITSEELNMLSDEALSEMLPGLRVVARALPSDKSRLVRIAQAKGLVVGMTGDGVNDAPALKQADIGFAMGSGTEIAKEAGDIVILDDNINSIAKAVCYGRTIFKSIRKFIIYQMSICMCAVGVTVIGPLIGVDMPITVIQMLWINIVMDTLAGLAFSGETARKAYMEEPPKSRDEPIINSQMSGQIIVNSVYSTALLLFFLKSPALQRIFGAYGEVYMLTAFFALFMFSAIFTSFCARTPQINLLDYLAGNKPFLWIMGLVTVIQIMIIYFGGSVFRTVELEINHMILIVSFAFTIIPVDMIRKYFVGKGSGYAGI